MIAMEGICIMVSESILEPTQPIAKFNFHETSYQEALDEYNTLLNLDFLLPSESTRMKFLEEWLDAYELDKSFEF